MPAPRKPWWRRILRIATRVVGVLVVLVVILVAFLHTRWGKSFVRGRVEAKLGAAVNGEVSVGDLDYAFLFGSIEIEDLEIRDARGAPAIRVGKIAVDLDRGSLLDGKPLLDRLAIEGVDVSIVQTADGTSNLTGLFKPSDREPLEQLRIAKLEVGGKVRLTKPDGTVIAIDDIGVTGNVDARPAAKEVDAIVDRLGANVTIARPPAAGPEVSTPRELAVELHDLAVHRKATGIDLEIATLAAGALSIDKVGAHVALVDGKPSGAQEVRLGKARIDNQELAEMLGKRLLLDDVVLELAVSGPEDKLAIHGAVKTRETRLTIDGTIDISTPARPRYQLAIAGKGKSLDVIASPAKREKIPPIESDLRIDIDGAGANPLDLEAKVEVAVGPTKVGALSVDSVHARIAAEHGAYKLDELVARGLGFTITASGDLAVDRTVNAKLAVAGSPAEAMQVLAAAGIEVPRKVPALHELDVTVTASGKLDGELAVELAPTTIAIAGGRIGISGHATVDHRKLAKASTKISLAGLDLAALSRLAGRPPKIGGTLSGTLDLARDGTTQRARYGVVLALREPALEIALRGTAGPSAAQTRAEIRRRNDHAVIATLVGQLPLDAKGFAPAGRWQLALDVPRRPLSELVALAPPEKRHVKLPSGEVELHLALAGSPMRPTGTLTVTADVAALPEGSEHVELAATIAPGPRGLAIHTLGKVAARAIAGELATIDATITTPMPFAHGKLDVARLRAGAVVDGKVVLPERELATLAVLRPKLAELGGKLAGTIAANGPLKTPVLDANVRWFGYGTAGGAPGETTLTATGTPAQLAAKIRHGELAIDLDVDRRDRDRMAVNARFRADTPLLPLIPAFAAGRIPAGAQLGTLRWNMDGAFALVRQPAGNLALDRADVTGTLDLQGGTFAIPNSHRTVHDIALSVVGEPGKLRLASLTAHESDVEKSDREIRISGELALEKVKPRSARLALGARDWLLSGTPLLGAHDAPRATATFDIGVDVDLAAPIVAVDATIASFAFRSPDRLERGHQPEYASVSGDIIYLDDGVVPGRLPYVPVEPPATPHKRRPIDIRVHVPRPIRIEQTPFDVMASGEIRVTVRDDGVKTRGELTMSGGTLSLFGHAHRLTSGKLAFTDEHPKGQLELAFERELPEPVRRELTRNDPYATVRFAGPPTKPKATLGGATNALFEIMAVYNAGRPVHVVHPGLPASSLVTVPRDDQLFIVTFMAQNLPHLLFLDRVNGWADPYQGAAAYGRITNFEGEHYAKDGKRRVRAIARPAVPGRSSAELQLDRVLVHDDRKALGVGVRAGDRVGGGVGLFFEWSSAE